MPGFQTSININPAPGIAGDFASANRRHSTLPMQGGFTSGPAGLTVGLFAWADTATGQILSNSGTGLPTGFVHRNLQALITTYLSEFGMTIPAGYPIGDLFDDGDFWVKNQGAGAVAINMKAFANSTNGTISFAATGATVAGSVETAWFAKTIGAAGELIKMSKTLPG